MITVSFVRFIRGQPRNIWREVVVLIDHRSTSGDQCNRRGAQAAEVETV